MTLGTNLGAGRKVLVVDDEAPIRLLLRVNLEVEGFEVVEAPDGVRGVHAAMTERPDVILLGVMMPRMDGWTAALELKADTSTAGIPIVFLTARGRHRDRLRGLELGAADYVTKPFNPLEIAPLLAELLSLSPSGRDAWRSVKLREATASFEADPDGPADERYDVVAQ